MTKSQVFRCPNIKLDSWCCGVGPLVSNNIGINILFVLVSNNILPKLPSGQWITHIRMSPTINSSIFFGNG